MSSSKAYRQEKYAIIMGFSSEVLNEDGSLKNTVFSRVFEGSVRYFLPILIVTARADSHIYRTIGIHQCGIHGRAASGPECKALHFRLQP